MSLLSGDLWQQLQSVRKKTHLPQTAQSIFNSAVWGELQIVKSLLRNSVKVSLPGSTWQRKWGSSDTECRVSICLLGLVIVVSAHTASKKTTHTPTFPGSSATKTVIYCICAHHRDPVNCNGRMCFSSYPVFTSVKLVQFVCDLTTALYVDLLRGYNKKANISVTFFYFKGLWETGATALLLEHPKWARVSLVLENESGTWARGMKGDQRGTVR